MKKRERFDVFPDAATAASALADFGKSFVRPCTKMTAAEIVRESGEGAWMRLLSRKYAGAADFYGRWAADAVPRMIKSARYVINQDQYDLMIRRTGMDLLRSWRDLSEERRALLSFGAAFRIVDLLSLAINESETCRSGSIQRFLHVPLDGSTLKPLRQCVDELLDRDFSIEIPASVPAGYVATEEQYVLFEEAIFTLAARAGVPPIVYSYYCAEL
jgi:hypothetical protein